MLLLSYLYSLTVKLILSLNNNYYQIIIKLNILFEYKFLFLYNHNEMFNHHILH